MSWHTPGDWQGPGSHLGASCLVIMPVCPLKFAKTGRPERYILLLIIVVVITAPELLADFRPFPGIWWTHRQAMDYGGLVLIAVAIWVLALRRD
jgi:hypothetical protein